ncbi:MAG: SGNH/GDSL hydrolase family protein, partial [Sedimentisphaerales bacterium]|nr:SGNH/GDSL hydrolase family protein [Sedimentisphaerales bacterium]
RNRRRIVLFHVAAAAVVLAPLVLTELALRGAVPAPVGDLEDPYVSFDGLRPLFVLDPTGARYETAPERLTAFWPQSFAAVKEPDGFRVFCLGGSTVQGRPYSVETSFTSWLELSLRAARPDGAWEVINCGGISYASYRLVPILRELLEYDPDLFILYTGHNEFLEDRSYGRIKRAPASLVRLHRTMLKLRSYALANQWFAGRRGSRSLRTVLPAEVRTKLDYEEALESYRRDETWRRGITEHFHRNAETMVRLAQAAGVPLILVNPVSNLTDCPPFKSEFRADLSEAELRQVMDLRQRAGAMGWDDVYARLGLLERAVEIDQRHAGLLYQVGKCYERLGRFAEAKDWFVRAKEEDVCPLRMIEPMREILLRLAARYDVPLVDARALIADRTEDGIPGRQWLLDHVHPRIEGHQLIAEALYEAMEQMQLVRAASGWPARRDELWQRQLSSLDEAYYARGAARLQRLRQWSRGRIPRNDGAGSDAE